MMRKTVLFCILSELLLSIPCVCWGYKERVLNPLKPLQSQLTKASDTYIVKNAFDLHGQILSIPKNATLKFGEEGAFQNGTIVFNDTKLEGRPSILCKVAGTIINKELYVDWFIQDDNLDLLNLANFYSIANGHEIIFSNRKASHHQTRSFNGKN